MAPDMWTGWGIHTLSATHPAFNLYNGFGLAARQRHHRGWL
jgi:glycogen debranching enzyme